MAKKHLESIPLCYVRVQPWVTNNLALELTDVPPLGMAYAYSLVSGEWLI